MSRFNKVFLMSCLLLLFSSMIVSAQDEAMHRYEWGNVNFQYLSHWKILLDEGDDSVRQIKLVPNGREDLSIFISLFKEFQELDEEYWKMPVKASVSFGLGLALKLAGEAGENAIALHYGRIELDSGPTMSARFSIFPPESGIFYALECFHAYAEEGDGAYMGMLITQGARGQIMDDFLYIQYIDEAYEIIESIALD